MPYTDSISYFTALNKELKSYKRSIPNLLIDLDLLDSNIEILLSSLQSNTDFRIVVKSLPSIDLLQYVMVKAATTKLMVFHQPFLTDIAQTCDEQVDILLGKPMPIKTAQYFYETLKSTDNNLNPYTQIQWLIDTQERLIQYLDLAKQLNQPLRVNLELDVGLHRGGFSNLSSLSTALVLISENKEWLSLSGFMGYDPHVVKLPKIIRSKKKALRLANEFYHQCKTLLKTEFPTLWSDQLTFNGAGSPTINLHNDTTSPLNDISAGSALVKPTTFDIPSLEAYVPACFISTPVLKKFKETNIPGLEKIKGILNILSKANRHSYFIYGGYWKADYYYPTGLKQNELFGASTNQTMVNSISTLDVDDFVFLRPQQSEFVFLQFGDILTIRNGRIIGEWKLLINN